MMLLILTCMALSQVRPDAGAFTADAGVKVATLSADAGVPAAPVPSAAPAPKKAELAPDVKALVDRVQAFYEQTKDFKADFTQAYTYKAFKRTQTSSGTVTFKKPALMRWEYAKPAPKTFVLAGERVYTYDPEAKLLTRAAINTSSLSASVTFLWGQGKLASEFSIAKKACATCTGTLLELTPLVPDPRFQRVLLEIDPASAQVVRSTVIDPDGSENAISFSKLTTNTNVDEAHFKLTPPPGTQVQDFAGNAPAAKP
ncbi:MAG: outer membrane lipoprotein carrier protein LolA [Archangium sp.]|nr:outer membrane lipoprotein carrier protein LolA [Archangium sp.]